MTTTAAPRRIVVGVDTSDNAARAAAWAAREAADRGLPLTVVHALELPAPAAVVGEPAGYAEEQREHGAALLDRVAAAVRARHPGLPVDTELSDLGAAHTLVGLSRDDTITVTGTRGHGGFAGLLLGSVSLKTAAHAHGPVVVVRGEQPGEPLREVVLGVEAHQSDGPVRFAFAVAAAHGAVVRAVRAWQPRAAYGGYYQDVDDAEREARADVEGLLKQVREEFPEVHVEIGAVRGNPVPTLIEAARGARLLVVGARRQRGALSVGAGYVVQGLLAHAATPVAVVPIA